MISTQRLSKHYGTLVALNNVDLEVNKGEIAGILGPNGAGKTTLFKILTGLIKPSSGHFQIESKKAKKIGAIIENPHLYEYLNAKQNLSVFANYQRLKLSNDQLDQLLKEVGLDKDRKDQIKNYSLGMKQRLGIATALLNQPDALILDEPFLGLDPIGMKDLRAMLIKLADEHNLAILVSSHQIEELSKVCSRLHLLHKGQITASGDTSAILHKATQQYRVVGKGISTSAIFKNIEHQIIGDLVVFSTTQIEARKIVSELMLNGHEIDEFGPEINLEDLYHTK